MNIISRYLARRRLNKRNELDRRPDGRFIPRRVSVALKMAEAMQRDDLKARLHRG